MSLFFDMIIRFGRSMNYRKPIFFISLSIILVVAYLLITGSSVLVYPILRNSNLPAGTFITWMGIIALPLSILYGIKKLRQPASQTERYFSLALKMLLLLAILWVAVSYLLAGNLSFSFGNKAGFQGGQTAMKIFWYFTYGIVGLPIVLLIFYGISKLFRKKEHDKK